MSLSIEAQDPKPGMAVKPNAVTMAQENPTKVEAVQVQAKTTNNSFDELDVEPPEFVCEDTEISSKRNIEYYGKEVQGVFGANFKKLAKVKLTEPAKEIDRSATSFISSILQSDAPVTDKSSDELRYATIHMSQAIMKNYLFKAIFIASDDDLFNKYFAELSEHYPWFMQANIDVTSKLSKKFPILTNNVTRQDLNLPTLLKTMFEMTSDSSTLVISRISDANEIISMATTLWKGKTDAGLGLLIDLVAQFKTDFPKWVSQPDGHLFRILTGYSNGSDQVVSQWFESQYNNRCDDLVEMAKRFRKEQRPHLAQLNQTRAEVEVHAEVRFIQRIVTRVS